MIYIKVELWPRGDKAAARTIASAKIWNTGEGDLNNGFYQYVIFGNSDTKMAQGKVSVFKRVNGHVWDLIAAVLVSARDFKQYFKQGIVDHEPINYKKKNQWNI